MEAFLASGTHWRIFNFVVFLAVLFFAVRRPVAEFWQGRRRSLSFAMEESRRMRKEAGKKVYDLEMRIGRLDREVQELVRSLREEGELEKNRIIEDAKSSADKLRNDSRKIIDQEFHKAREGLKRQVAELSVEMAGRLIRDTFQASDQERLSRNTLKQLEARL